MACINTLVLCIYKYTHMLWCFPDFSVTRFVLILHSTFIYFSAPAIAISTMSEKGNKAPAAGIPKYMKFTIGGLAGLVLIKTSIHKKGVYMMHV